VNIKISEYVLEISDIRINIMLIQEISRLDIFNSDTILPKRITILLYRFI
jgi:hypothetical protein